MYELTISSKNGLVQDFKATIDNLGIVNETLLETVLEDGSIYNIRKYCHINEKNDLIGVSIVEEVCGVNRLESKRLLFIDGIQENKQVKQDSEHVTLDIKYLNTGLKCLGENSFKYISDTETEYNFSVTDSGNYYVIESDNTMTSNVKISVYTQLSKYFKSIPYELYNIKDLLTGYLITDIDVRYLKDGLISVNYKLSNSNIIFAYDANNQTLKIGYSNMLQVDIDTIKDIFINNILQTTDIESISCIDLNAFINI